MALTSIYGRILPLLGKFDQFSSNSKVIKICIKIGECGFEAQGEEKTVNEYFEKFHELIIALRKTSSENHVSQGKTKDCGQLKDFDKPEKPLPDLEKILETDPLSSVLISRTPPSGKESEAKLVLLLLLGYLEIRGVSEVPVLTLKQGIKYSLHPVLRLDRVIHHYLRDRFVIKIGRGKGGRYRLTPLGAKKAISIAEELLSELNGA
jgi:hypothetical protein